MTAFLIAQKELKELFRDKKNIALNIVFPFAIVLLMVFSSVAVSTWNEKDPRIRIAVNPELRRYMEISSNICVLEEKDSDEIPDIIKSGKCRLGAIWDVQTESLSFIQNSEDEKDPLILSVKGNIEKNVRLALHPEISLPPVITASKSVLNDYGAIFEKNFAVVISAVVMILAIRLNNANAYYLSTKEKSTGTLEILLVSPVKKRTIVLGKWLTNFISCFTMAIIVCLPLLLLFWAVSDLFMKLNLGLLPRLPLVLSGLIAFTGVFSLLQLTLGFLAESSKQTQVFLVYSPWLVLAPVLILMSIELKSPAPAATILSWLDFIPIINFYEMIKMMVLAQLNIAKLLVECISNGLLVVVCLKILLKQFYSEKVLFFND